tara:strand:+ start:2519 stop:3319 length:801 start_codon:yes stop_codon:yes gene_type:complete
MNDVSKLTRKREASEGPAYAAPALEKGLDVLELLCRSESALSIKTIAQILGRSVGELYRMVSCLVERGYLVNVDDKYHLSTKLFELAHINPPTHRLLTEAMPVMQKLSAELDQSCHLSVYATGRQMVVAKVDSPSGMGFSVRVGAELDVLVSASGRVLLAFQDQVTRRQRIIESAERRPEQADPQIEIVLDTIRARGFESSPSVQVRGLYAVAFPIGDTSGHAIAALTVPFAERIDLAHRRSIDSIERSLGESAQEITSRTGGLVT